MRTAVLLVALALVGPSASIAKADAAGRAESAQVSQVAPGVWRLRFGNPEKFTPSSFRSAMPATPAMAKMPTAAQMPLSASKITSRRSARGCSIELPMAAGEKFYGLGLNTAIWELSNRRAWVAPSDNPESLLNESHAPEPFYVSTSGYGVYVDTARYVRFSFGNAVLKGDPDGSHRGVLAEIPTAQGVDVYIVAGPSALDAVSRYNLFSGGGAVPPLWGLGISYRCDHDFSATEATALAESFRKDDIPCDMFGLEPGWQTHTYSSSFLWNKKLFPDPDGFINRMHDLGYRLSFWEHPFTHPTSPIYQALMPFSGSFQVWGGLVPDFATPQGRKIFLGQQNESLLSKGVDSLKIDEVDNQPFSESPWSFPEASVFPSGLDGEQMHSLFGTLAQQTMLEPFRQKNRRTWGLARESHALAAPLPYTIYSDTYDHRDYVRGLAKTGFGGHLWVPEVRDSGSVEELVRRTQTVIFSPYAMINCWYMKMPPWQQINAEKGNAGVVMPEHAEATALVRDLFKLRMSLVPYLYSAFNEYHLHGTPPVRALLLDYPSDAPARAVDDQFMFGPSLMVAPMFTGQTKRSVYFPPGDWLDFFTGEKIRGGRKIDVTKPLSQMPLYVKGDCLLPLANPVANLGPGTTFQLTIRVYGTNPPPFTLYEDDGETFDFEKNVQNRITLTWDGTKGSTSREGGYAGSPRYRVESWERAGAR